MKLFLLIYVFSLQLLVNSSSSKSWSYEDDPMFYGAQISKISSPMESERTLVKMSIFGKREKRSTGDTSTSLPVGETTPEVESTSEPEPEPGGNVTAEPETIPESETRPEGEPESESENSSLSGQEAGLGGNVTTEPETAPESEPEPSASKWIFVAMLVILIIVILACNLCVLWAIAKCKSLRTPTNIFILSLAVSDICIGVFVIPGVLSAQFSEAYLINIICKICHYASHLSTAAASLSLAAIAGDRLRSIARPLKPKFTRKQVSILVAVLWFIACIYGMRAPLVFSLTAVSVDGKSGFICGVSAELSTANEPLIVLDFIVVLAIPAIIITASYVAMIYVLLKNNRNVQSMQSEGRKNTKALRISVLVVALFIVCHLPVHALRLYFVSKETITATSLHLMNAFDILSFFNSVLNPIVYGYLNKKIRDGFVEVCCLSQRGSGRKIKVGVQSKVHPQSISKTGLSNIATVVEPSIFTSGTA